MSDDLKINVDNHPAIQQLDALGKAVDSLDAKLKTLNSSNLRSVRAEFEAMKKGPVEAIRDLAQIMQSELKGLPKNFSGLSSGMKQAMHTTFNEVRAQLARENAALTAQVIDSIATSAREVGVKRTQLVGDFSPYNARLRPALESTKAESYDATEATRYARALQRMATEQNEADARYVAMRKDSLARGKVQITQAAREMIAAQNNTIISKARDAGIPTNNVIGDFSPYNAKGHVEAESRLMSLSKTMAKFAGDTNYAHSAVRGLASGFNLLWLTWGSTLPLLAGAAISMTFREVVKVGMEVEQELTKIAALSGVSTEGVTVLKDRLLEMSAKGPFGPVEIAQAMKTLSLAGLDAKDVFEGIRPVLNFAVGGDTTVAKAADVITSVTTAYKLGAAGMEYVGDIISKTAAATKASVEDMGEAFKMASAVSGQYGISLRETAITLGLLSNVGVKGTAAGTALRNMLQDLVGRTPKATEALKTLGVTIKDVIGEDGKFKPLEGIFKTMSEGLGKLTGPDQVKQLKKIFSERGEKGGAEFFDGIKRIADETGQSMTTVFQKLANDVDNASGFTIVAAAKMALTVENQFKSVAAAFKSATTQAFEGIQPQLVSIAVQIKEVFNSNEFKNNLQAMVLTISDAILFVLKYGRALLEAGAIAVTFTSTLVVLGGIFKGIVAYQATASVGMAALSAAFAATPIGLIITGIALAIGAGVLAWKLFTKETNNAEIASRSFADNGKALLDRLKSEEDRLLKINMARAEGITLEEYEIKLRAVKARGVSTPEQLAAERELMEARNLQNNGAKFSESQAKAVKARVTRAELLVNDANNAAKKQILDIEMTAANVAALRKMEDERMLAQAAERNKKTVGKNSLVDPVGVHGARGYTESLSVLNDYYSKENGLLNKAMTDQLDLNKRMHAAKLVDDKTFAATEYDIVRKSESDKLDLISYINTKRAIELTQEYVNLASKYGNKVVDSGRTITDQQIDASSSAIRGQLQAVRNYWVKYDKEIELGRTALATVVEDTNHRMSVSFTDYAKTMADRSAVFEKAFGTLRDLEARIGEADPTSTKNKTPWEAASIEAKAKSVKSLSDELARMSYVIKELEGEQDFWGERAREGDPVAAVNLMQNAIKVASLRAKRDEFTSGAGTVADKAAAKASAQAFQNEFDKWEQDLKVGIGDSISEAVFNGGAAGGKKLRAILEQQLIRRPFTIILDGILSKAFGSMGGSGGSMGSFFNMFTNGGANTWGGSMWSGNSAVNAPGGASFGADIGFDLGALGALATGGPANPNSMYRVNEVGMEMLSVGGKDYLMTGANRGNITPANAVGKAVNQTLNIHIDSRSDQAQVYAMVDNAVKTGNARLVNELRVQHLI